MASSRILLVSEGIAAFFKFLLQTYSNNSYLFLSIEVSHFFTRYWFLKSS